MLMRTAQDEQQSPKYSHFERERRWLVAADKVPTRGGQAGVLIEDRYICGTRIRLRRMTDEATGAVSLKLTKKYDAADPRTRAIVTAYLTEAEYAVFAGLSANELSKRRYKADWRGLAFSVDVFAGSHAGLVLAEIEMDDHDSLCALAPPDWAGREVTDDEAFQGGNLAASGLVPQP